jgi:hypothetical protein
MPAGAVHVYVPGVVNATWPAKGIGGNKPKPKFLDGAPPNVDNNGIINL